MPRHTGELETVKRTTRSTVINLYFSLIDPLRSTPEYFTYQHYGREETVKVYIIQALKWRRDKKLAVLARYLFP